MDSTDENLRSQRLVDSLLAECLEVRSERRLELTAYLQPMLYRLALRLQSTPLLQLLAMLAVQSGMQFLDGNTHEH